MSDSLKEKTAKGLLWGGLSNGMIQILGALFGIIMLNLLSPSDYGKIAVLLIYSGIASSLQESGFIAAIANKKNPSHEDYNAVFWFNLIVSAMIYVILWFASPYIAEFNHEPVLTPLARYLFLGFFISSFGIAQRAYIFGHLMVKQQSVINVLALVLSNVTGVCMALNGLAFWGLATQHIAYVTIVMLGNWYISPWRPTMNINLRPAVDMFAFSSKILVTNLFSQLNTHVFSFLLGRYYNTNVVGQYSNARKWNDMACYTINGMLNGVTQPVLAKVRDDEGRYRNVFRKMLRFTCFIVFPCMFGLSIISREFILITVGEKWLESARLLSIICVYGAFYPLHTLYNNMVISRGKSGIGMLCTISLCVCVWIGLVAMKDYGIEAMLLYFITANILWLLIWQWFAWRLFHLAYLDAFKDVLPFLAITLIVMGVTYYATLSIDSILLSLIAKVIMAAVLYSGVMYVCRVRIMRETIDYLKRK